MHRSFVINTKNNKPIIYEVEIEHVTALEDSSVVDLLPGEFKAKILKPESFHDKIETLTGGKKEFVNVPPVWYSFAFFSPLEVAKQAAAQLIRSEFEFKLRKYGTTFSEDDVTASINSIEVNLLGS